jgi:hypothetical protein
MGPHDGNEVHATLVPPHSIPVSPPFCLPSLQLGQSPHETGDRTCFSGSHACGQQHRRNLSLTFTHGSRNVVPDKLPEVCGTYWLP